MTFSQRLWLATHRLQSSVLQPRYEAVLRENEQVIVRKQFASLFRAGGWATAQMLIRKRRCSFEIIPLGSH